MRIRQSVVQAREILETLQLGHLGALGGLPREDVQMRESPVPRLDQRRVDRERLFHRCRAKRDPDGEHEREPGPLLPHGSEVVYMRIPGGARRARTEEQRRIADDESCVVLLALEPADVAQLRVARYEPGSTPPHVLEQQLE